MSLRDQDNHSEVVEIRPDQFQVAYRDGISKEFRKELGVEALKPDDETDPSINLDSADRHLKIALVRRVDELMLSVRTLNCLQSHHCEYVGDVVCLMESQLLCLPNFGRKSLKELRNTLKHLGLQMGCSIKGWNYETAEELRRELENEIHESLAIDFQPQCCSEQQTLEDELIAIAKVVASNRNVEIITSYWGWSGNGQRTLESVGQEHGITRERVRQIVAKAEKKLKKLPLPCPKLKEAASYLENRAPEFENVLGDALASAGIADSAFQVSGVITAIRIMGVQSSIQLTRIEHLKIMISSGDTTAKNIKSLLKLVRSLSRIQGCVNIDDILERSTVDNKKIRKFFVEVVNCHSDLSWLSDDKKWLWPVPYEGMKKNRLINFIQKIFSVAQSLHISELRQGLSRHHRLVFAPPSRVLLEICRQLDFLEVKGSRVETTSGETLPSTLSWLETVLIKAFNGKPLLSREALETNALALGMNRSSFYVMIGYSVVVAD